MRSIVLLSAAGLATAFLALTPTAAAHDGVCTVSVLPVGWDLSGCAHNGGHTTVNLYNGALSIVGTQCNWLLGNPLMGGGSCPFMFRALQNPF